MAKLVGVFGTSHSPVLITPVADWPELEPTISRPELPRLGNVRAQWPAHQQRYADACARLHRAIVDARPDVLVVVGSDQGENFDDRSAPVFELFIGEQLEASAANRRVEGVTEHRICMPVAREFGLGVLAHLCTSGFDVSQSSRPSDPFGVGHAVTWPLRFLDLAQERFQVLPLVTNVWNPPNNPSIARCIALGRALRSAIEAHPQPLRVAVLASGGLSHLVLDEDLDARVLAALRSPGTEGWAGINDAELYDAHTDHGLPLRLNGTSEISDWVIADACAGSAADVIDYIAAYRTQSGYGVGMCFAKWDTTSPSDRI